MTLAASMHLLDRSEPDIRSIVQIKADIGQSEGESNISLNLHNNQMSRSALSNKCFIMPKALDGHGKKSFLLLKSQMSSNSF